MKKLKLFLTILSVLATIFAKAQAPVPFTAGNVVIYRVGDGSAALSGSKGNATPVFLDEYTPTGTLVQSIAMPTAINGANKILTAPSSNISGNGVNGLLTLSSDGRYLIIPGYNAPVGTVDILSDDIYEKTIGLVDYNGVINTTSTVNTNAYSGSNDGTIKSAASINGTDLWFAGDAIGVVYTTIGSGTSVQLGKNAEDLQTAINISNGQLYISGQTVSSSTGIRLATVGTGTPTTSGQTVTALPGYPLTSTPDQFVFFDLDAGVAGLDVLYVADHGANALRKYSLVSGTWTLNGTIGTTSDDYVGLTGTVSGTTVSLYATRGTVSLSNLPGSFVKLTDATGYNGAFAGVPTLVVTGAANTQLRGIALVPQAPSVKVSTKIFLQGTYSSALSRHKDVNATWAAVLNANALTQPYNTAAFGNYAGTENVSSGFFTSTEATTDILDWVLLELHDATTPTTIIARRAAFIREDGKIVDLDGTSDVAFSNVNNGNYYIVIRHRNHLGVRSATAISLSNTSTLYDFTIAQTQAYQDGTLTNNSAMKDLGGSVFGMWAGNANSNTTVRFTGLSNDAGAILSALGGNQAAILSSVYNSADLNMDGTVRYTGLNNDAGVLLSVLASNQAIVYTQHQ